MHFLALTLGYYKNLISHDMLVEFKHYKIMLLIISVMSTPPRRILIIMVVQLLANNYVCVKLVNHCLILKTIKEY